MEFIRYEEKGRVGIITLSREESLNALCTPMLREIDKLLDEIDTDEIRCLIITGAGKKAFAAGADIEEMSDMSPVESRKYSLYGNSLMRKIETYPIPVIAAVNGYCLGGACEMSLSCDFRICSDNAVFGQPEAGLGITPGWGGTQRMARAVGIAMAKQIMYTARNFKADEALRIGLVNSVHPQDELMDYALKLAEKISSNAPIAVRACKEASTRGISMDLDQACKIESDLFSSCIGTYDQRNAMKAFMNKEKYTDFQNR